MTPEIGRLLDGQDSVSLFPDAEAERVIGRYAAGWLIMVSLSGQPKERADPDLERLEGLDEIWALCFRRPRPGWRVFGRFLQRDMFIGLLAYDRLILDGRRTYAGYAAGTVPAWQAIFGPEEPLRGEAIEDYLTGVTRDAD